MQAWAVWADPRSLATTRGIISFPLGTKMFQFPRLPSSSLWVQQEDAAGLLQRVSPFGNPRINTCTRLPEAYRSVPRPSSAFGAKAFTVSSYQLIHVMRRNRNFSCFIRSIQLLMCHCFGGLSPRGDSHLWSGSPLVGQLDYFTQDDPAHRRVVK